MGEAYQIRDQDLSYNLTFQVVGSADVLQEKGIEILFWKT